MWSSPAIPGLAIGLLAALASVASLVNGFVYDDRPLILDNPRLHHLTHFARLWGETYWPPWMGAGLYRPLTMSAFAVQWQIGRGAPWAFHAANMALYVTIALLMYGLARELLSGAAAWIAAALFAVHPVHVEAVGNVVGQSELWAACGVLAAVVSFVTWRRSAVASLEGRAGSSSGWPRPLDPLARQMRAESVGGLSHQALLVLFIAGACFAKEHAVVAPLLLVAAELTIVGDPRPARQRWCALRPLALLLMAVVLAFVVVRMHVIGALAGDRPNVVLEHLSPPAQRWTMLGVVGEWIRLLLWPARLVSEYAPRDIALHERFDVSLLPSVLVVGLVLVLFVASVRHWRVAAFAILWLGATLALVSNLVVPTGVLLAERTLFLPSVGAMVLVGALVDRVLVRTSGGRTSPMGSKRALMLAAFVGPLLVAGLWRSADRQGVWRSNATLFAQAPLDAPLSYRAHDVYAGLLFDQGDRARGEHEARVGLALYPHDPLLYRDLAQEYMRAGLCPAAMPLLRRSIVEQGSMETDAHLLLGECLLALRDPVSARREIVRGVAAGTYAHYGPGYHKVLIAIDSVVGHDAATRGPTASGRGAP